MKSALSVSMCAAVLMIASLSRGETKDDDLVLCKEITKTKMTEVKYDLLSASKM